MGNITLRLKFLEPLMLRDHGEFDPSSRGVSSYATSLILPRPSTMVGTLISTFMLLGTSGLKCMNMRTWEELLECYREVLDSLGIEAIRGPYVFRHKHMYVPVRFGNKFMLVDYEQVRYFLLEHPDYGNVLEKCFSNLGNEDCEVLDALKTVENELGKYKLEVSESQRVGIHLKLRRGKESSKTVEEGYIYISRYISYPADTEIIFKIVVRNAAKFKQLPNRKVAIKFGGEHRIATLIIDDSGAFEDLDDFLNRTNFDYALLVSPMPLRKDYVRNVRFIGEFGIIGFGYNIAKKCRKPLHPAIMEGSILCVKVPQNTPVNKLLRYGLYCTLDLREKGYDTLGRVGYASYIPLISN